MNREAAIARLLSEHEVLSQEHLKSTKAGAPAFAREFRLRLDGIERALVGLVGTQEISIAETTVLGELKSQSLPATDRHS